MWEFIPASKKYKILENKLSWFHKLKNKKRISR